MLTLSWHEQMLLPNIVLYLSINVSPFVGLTGSFQKLVAASEHRQGNKTVGWKEDRIISFSGSRSLKCLTSSPLSFVKAEKEAEGREYLKPKPKGFFTLHPWTSCNPQPRVYFHYLLVKEENIITCRKF